MAIARPKPRLSDTEKAILVVVSEILLENLDALPVCANRVDSLVPVSDEQAENLLRLVSELTSSRVFLERWFFIHNVVGPSLFADDERLRKLFGSLRGMRGRQYLSLDGWWKAYLARLGVSNAQYRGRTIQPLSFDEFVKLEKRLFLDLNLDPRISEILMSLVERQRDLIEEQRSIQLDRSMISPLSVAGIPRAILGPLRTALTEILADKFRRELPRDYLSGLATIVSNLSVLGTTRDWDVTGTISGLCGAMPFVVGRR